MSVSIPEFWDLLRDSRLLAAEQVQQLAMDYGSVKGSAEQGNAKTLAQWLVARNVLSKYQTTILLAGRPGPFYYGDYKVYDRVEKGRLAGQFRAVHAPTGHPVLLQFLTGPVISDADLWAAAANETLAACSVVSPHVQRFFEPVDLQSFKFLVSEDLRGDAVDQRLAVGRFPAPEAARIVRLAAIGLAQMHQCGRVHGDVRPLNVLLESIPNHPGNVKLLFDPTQPPEPFDFTQQQPDGRLAKMADYLAPELMSPGRVPDPLSDIYALGCTLYAMLSGNPPFAGGNIQQKMTRHASEAIRPLEGFGVPQPLAQLVTYMMAKNPQVRYQSAAIVAEQIAAFVDPNVLYAQPPQPAATLGSFEQFVRQKHAALSAPKKPAGM
ncbi:MAG TPA: protein kinase, partial [Pirellulaceae bacterium]|nr:protein kinase [Pirellulaceae bacterium]